MFYKYVIAFFLIFAAQAASILYDDPDVIHLNPIVTAHNRQKRSPVPGRAMMLHGYFANPQHTAYQGYDNYNSRPYNPQGSMSAFAAGDTVSAGSSYYGGGGGGSSGYDCNQCNGAKTPSNGNGHKNGNGHHNGNGNGYPTNGNGYQYHGNGNGKPNNGNGQPVEGNGGESEVPRGNGNVPEEGYLGDQPAADEIPKGETIAPAAPTHSAIPEKPKKDGADVSEEDDDEAFFNNGKGQGRGPFYGTFFPMIFGGYPGGKGGGRDEGSAYNPGVATAIANSFSTGRGAVASSHATAYGGPHFIPSGFRKNGSRGRPN